MTYYTIPTPMPHSWHENEDRHWDWDGRDQWWLNPGADFWRSRTPEVPIINHDSYRRLRGDERESSSRKAKPKKYWARSVDRRRRGAWCRFMDALTGEAPDVFIVVKKSRRSGFSGSAYPNWWPTWERPEWNVSDKVECPREGLKLPAREGFVEEPRWARPRGRYSSSYPWYEPADIARNWNSGDFVDWRSLVKR